MKTHLLILIVIVVKSQLKMLENKCNWDKKLLCTILEQTELGLYSPKVLCASSFFNFSKTKLHLIFTGSRSIKSAYYFL